MGTIYIVRTRKIELSRNYFPSKTIVILFKLIFEWLTSLS